ncbi:hypothetical protein GQ44DRAFT_734902 [Phaeosphaeriaceae sp. PMI808]|nr:hypothetical protein GQ44DRAFT_734902 [Phaeosphaeriaceae sp. PMI808]
MSSALLARTQKGNANNDGSEDQLHDLREPYDHVNIPIMTPEQAMKMFIAWNLEREHGDLGFNSTARKPPLSPLGKSLMSYEASQTVQKHADDIFEYSYGNIGIAKARLDLLHGMESLDMLETRKDQLPATIVTLFDMAIKRIEAQHACQRDIALKALAASANSVYGVSIPSLRGQLESPDTPEIRSGEEILEATKGLLIGTLYDDPQKLTVFNQNLTYYVTQRYHRSIHRASVQLETKLRFEPQNLSTTPTRVTAHKLERSVTGLQSIYEAPIQPFLIRKGTRAWV